MTEEEKLLLDVITSDPVTIATTLKQLLHCGKEQHRTHTVGFPVAASELVTTGADTCEVAAPVG